MIEIDFLHESRPVPRNIPSYPDKQLDSHPYTIYVTDTRPGLEIGKTFVYSFDVDDVFPKVNIPLDGAEKLKFDFGQPYNSVYESLSYFRNRVDYGREPLHFETYTSHDQARIYERMAIIAQHNT